jgi:tetratricopeptide (TPR) repeat protein
MLYLIKPSFPERAIKYLQKSADFGMTFAYGWLGAAYALAGQRDEALKILHELDKIEKERYISPFKKLGIYLKPGLKRFRFLKTKYVTPLTKCLVYLALNKQDEALEWLEKSDQERDYFFPEMIKVMDRFDFPWAEEFKVQPRLKDLQKKIKTG